MNPSTLEIIATCLFGLAILHTFSVKRFETLAHKYPEGSVRENLFHLLGEVEAVFGIWAGIFIIVMAAMAGGHTAVEYLEGEVEGFNVEFVEPAFVFVIMTMAATKPILDMCTGLIATLSRFLPLGPSASFYVIALILGPLLGSFITEPAAMTVTALILKKRYYDRGMSSKFMYATIGLLFVNVSIGGTLTNFAAPPVLMVATPERWNWDMGHMLLHFGWKAALAVIINTLIVSMTFLRELKTFDNKAVHPSDADTPERPATPWWLVLIHVGFMAGVVMMAHHMVVFFFLFLFFLGVVAVTMEYQEELKLKEGLLVAFFLGGLVILGTYQKWWLQPVLGSLGDLPLFLGATGLTAITDNAALTYLGYVAQIQSDGAQYALVAGAVCGGGLTVIANAPNPAGFGILKSSFGSSGISPIGLLVSALLPTLIAMACFWFLPNLG